MIENRENSTSYREPDIQPRKRPYYLGDDQDVYFDPNDCGIKNPTKILAFLAKKPATDFALLLQTPNKTVKLDGSKGGNWTNISRIRDALEIVDKTTGNTHFTDRLKTSRRSGGYRWEDKALKKPLKSILK